MSWNPTEKEISAVLAFEGPRRYEYFVKKAADEEQVCGVCTTEQAGRWLWMMIVEHTCLYGPHSPYAELCTNGPRAAFAPKPLELDVWPNSPLKKPHG